ncbi:MAG: type I DNA topoisomerase [Eubacteriales bacterium]|nr:type I DNA topoisomerase [Eubacteriales bacterium]
MGKTLIIVESPAKANTIGRYLGKDYEVMASVGHVRDLPTSTLGVNTAQNFKPLYITMPGKESVLAALKKKKQSADRVLLATDPDREGEAIAWHLAQALKLDPSENCRISFNEITKKAILENIEKPRPLDMNLVDAQQGRRILDRLVGYELSPLLWEKIQKGLSAGRVQSVACKLLVDRERAIQAFEPEEYWLLKAILQSSKTEPSFVARYHGQLKDGKVSKRTIPNEESCKEILAYLKEQDFVLSELKKRNLKRQSYPPFTTSTLQQEASRYLNFSAGRTMRAAQQLYEGIKLSEEGQTSLISYIRTDSLRISTEAIAPARDYIERRYGAEYLPPKPRFFKNKRAAQDAHEAIRPIHFDLPPEKLRSELGGDQFKLYKLIWDKFIASQMEAAKIESINLQILAGIEVFKARGERVIFPGWQAVYGFKEESAEDDEKADLPELSEGQKLLLEKLEHEQKFTQPPARYTEASLIKEMEEKGIGRPSTYAPTINTLFNRRYAEKDGRSLIPSELCFLVTVMLEENFANIVDSEFTARMESQLDTVEEGKKDWVEVLSEFYPSFHEQVEKAAKTVEKHEFPEEKIGEKCPECKDGDLVKKHGRFGQFIACTNYPDCRYTRNIEERAEGKCPICGSGLLIKRRRKRPSSIFYVCAKEADKPDCDFISWDLPIEKNCPSCGAYMVKKRYRNRFFERCSNPDCESNKSRSKSKKTKASKSKPKTDPEAKPEKKSEAE